MLLRYTVFELTYNIYFLGLNLNKAIEIYSFYGRLEERLYLNFLQKLNTKTFNYLGTIRKDNFQSAEKKVFIQIIKIKQNSQQLL